MTDDAAALRLSLSSAQLDKIDAWIAQQPEPRPTREAAVQRILAGALGDGDGEVIATEDLNSSNDE